MRRWSRIGASGESLARDEAGQVKMLEAWGADPRSVVQVDLRVFVGAPVSVFSFLPWDQRDRLMVVAALRYGPFRQLRASRGAAR
jgi:hypothetical protein